MNSWEECRNYGLIQIESNNDTLVRLYYNQFCYVYAGGPMWIHVEDARWQGDHLILRGKDDYGVPRVYVMDGFHSYRSI
jgi:hypothetical protein